MLYARLRLERVFDLRYRDLDNRWYPAEMRGELIRTRGRVVAGLAGNFVFREDHGIKEPRRTFRAPRDGQSPGQALLP